MQVTWIFHIWEWTKRWKILAVNKNTTYPLSFVGGHKNGKIHRIFLLILWQWYWEFHPTLMFAFLYCKYMYGEKSRYELDHQHVQKLKSFLYSYILYLIDYNIHTVWSAMTLNFEHRDLEYACLYVCILCVVFSCVIRCLVICQTPVTWSLCNI
jgi:hypothetical protein